MSNCFLLMFLCFRFLFLESSILCFLSLLLLLNLVIVTHCEHSGVTRAHNSLTLNQPWPHNAVSNMVVIQVLILVHGSQKIPMASVTVSDDFSTEHNAQTAFTLLLYVRTFHACSFSLLVCLSCSLFSLSPVASFLLDSLSPSLTDPAFNCCERASWTHDKTCL